LVTALADLGAHVIWLPTIHIAPPDDPAPLEAALARARSGAYAWLVFTSANAVSPVADRVPGLPPPTRVAAVGPASAAALAARGWRVDLVAPTHTAEALVVALAALDDVAGLRILFPKADVARDTVEAGLAARGATVDAVVAYRTVPAEPDAAALGEVRAGVDVATFTAGSAVRAFAAMVEGRAAEVLGGARVACIGSETARAAREIGLAVHIVPDDHTVAALVTAIAAAIAADRAAGGSSA